jgi:peptidyl-prolyl cis-trans isomerase B (cyclophilin B)
LKSYLFCALILVFAACKPATQEPTTAQSETVTTAASETVSATTETTTTTATEAAPPPVSEEKRPMSQSQEKVAEIHTTAGDITIRFFPDVAPNHVKNFLDLAGKGFYDGTKFHRVIPGFMIQGGDPNTKSGAPQTWGMGGSDSHVRAEFNSIPHRRGIVSMARSSDPNSASSQFFIVVKDSNFLDNNYTVFGQVTKGMDVADKIVSAPHGAQDRPNNPTAITSITIRDAKADEKGPAPK